MCSCVAGVKQGEPGHFLNVSKRIRAQQLTHTFVAVIMHLKCAVGTESAFAGGVFVKRAAKSPAMCTMGSCVSAVISAVISTEDYNVEV